MLIGTPHFSRQTAHSFLLIRATQSEDMDLCTATKSLFLALPSLLSLLHLYLHRYQQVNMFETEPVIFLIKPPPSLPHWLQPETWESSWIPPSLCLGPTSNQSPSPDSSKSKSLSTASTCLQPPRYHLSVDYCKISLLFSPVLPLSIYIGTAAKGDFSKCKSFHFTTIALRIKPKLPRCFQASEHLVLTLKLSYSWLKRSTLFCI